MPTLPELKIVDLKGDLLGVICQSDGGELTLTVHDQSCQKDLTDLFEQVQKQDLYLIGGSTFSQNEQKVHQTSKMKVAPGTIEYLKAIQDWIIRSRQVVNGRRIRALFVSKE